MRENSEQHQALFQGCLKFLKEKHKLATIVFHMQGKYHKLDLIKFCSAEV